MGLGDLGANGMGIPIGKLVLYMRRAAEPEAEWLCAVLHRESSGLGVNARIRPDGRIEITWHAPPARALHAQGAATRSVRRA